MKREYYLMHLNDKVALVQLDEVTEELTAFKLIDKSKAPYLGNADIGKMSRWLKHRSIPGTRNQIRDLLIKEGCSSTTEYLFKNLALSVTDCYWLRPSSESQLNWENVNLYKQYNEQQMPVHNNDTYSPNASLNGQMSKFVDMESNPTSIVKSAYLHNSYGLQCFNEAFATSIHKSQNWDNYVPYTAWVDEENGLSYTRCPLFTSNSLEFIPAYEVVESQKRQGDMSEYESFIHICIDYGITDAQLFMDYLTLTDFIISNTDRHLGNFGILRNPFTLEISGIAPIFDNGNSMFYDRNLSKSMSRYQLLAVPVNGFYTKEESFLRQIKNKNIVDIKLLPSKTDVYDFYRGFNVPDLATTIIASNYETKVKMVKDLQAGKTISLYREKQLEKSLKKL